MGIGAHDSCSFDMSVNFQAAADFIHMALSRGGERRVRGEICRHFCFQINIAMLLWFPGKVLVHCRVGVSRSATLVLAYLMLKQDLTLVEAICAVKDNRGVIPNRGFLRQLIKLDGRLFRARWTRATSRSPELKNKYIKKYMTRSIIWRIVKNIIRCIHFHSTCTDIVFEKKFTPSEYFVDCAFLAKYIFRCCQFVHV